MCPHSCCSYVPTVKALGGLQTYHPHPPPPPAAHLEPIKKLSALSQLRKRSSSWELRKGGGREKQAENSFPSMLQTFRSGSSGERAKAGCVRRVAFWRPSALGYECQESISTSFPPLPRPSSHPCPSSPTVLLPAPEGGDYCSPQQANPGESHLLKLSLLALCGS